MECKATHVAGISMLTMTADWLGPGQAN